MTHMTYSEFQAAFPDGVPPQLLAAYDEARTDYLEQVEEAAQALTRVLISSGGSNDLALAMTCREVEAMTHLLRVAGHDTEADDWMRAHQNDDESGEGLNVHDTTTAEED